MCVIATNKRSIVMKFTLFIIILWVTSILSQQFTLEFKNPKPTGSNLYDVVALSPNDVRIYGGASTTIESNDGLNTYTMRYIDPVRTDIWSVFYLDQNIAYACGDDGLMMVTTDGGLNWTKQNTWVTSRLYDVEFLNPDSGIAIGASGLVIRTTDGGTTWSTSYYQTSTNYKIHIVNSNLIFIGSAATAGRLAKSTDFGLTWTPITSSVLTSSVYGIFFLNENEGWLATGSNGILFSSDGGNTWVQQVANANIIYDVRFINNQVGFAVDSRGVIFSTTNGGTTWNQYQIPTKKALRSISIKGNNIYTVGDAGSIYVSYDLGQTWNAKVNYIGDASFFQRRVIFFNENIGYVCGGSTSAADSLGYILKTTDGGETWSQLPYNFKTQLYSVTSPSENVIYASAASSLVFKSTDGGVTWNKMTLPVAATTFWDIQFYNNDYGFVVGSSGRILSTTDGGANWTSMTSPFGTSTIYSFAFLDSATIVAVGVGAKAYKSTNAGVSWNAISPGIPGSYFIVRFANQNVGYIGSYVSPSGYVSKTTDGGATWNPLPYPGTQSVWGIACKGDSLVYVVDLYGNLYYSNEGGQNWTSVPRIFGPNVFYCSLAGDKLFMSGSNGVIIKGYAPAIPQFMSKFHVNSGWNIISVPLKTSDMRKTTLFPNAVSPAFGYDNQYYNADTLELSKGYWLKFPDQDSISITGIKTTSYTINLNQGWNLIGVYDHNVNVNDITTIPPDILTSNFFKFENGYKFTNTLMVGQGYWIKSSQVGILNLPSVFRKAGVVSIINEIEGEPKIILEDSRKNVAELYLVTKELSKQIELPPPPPSGIFDVRFAGDKLTEQFSDEFKEIIINSAAYPIKISIEGANINIVDGLNGKIVNKSVKSGESIAIENENIKVIKIRPMNLVYKFDLSQNYPNPFNPITNIKFTLPERMRIKLTVYNSLGQEVKTLVNDELESGVHLVTFDGSEYSSGIYFYKIEAENYRNVKKMILIK